MVFISNSSKALLIVSRVVLFSVAIMRAYPPALSIHVTSMPMFPLFLSMCRVRVILPGIIILIIFQRQCLRAREYEACSACHSSLAMVEIESLIGGMGNSKEKQQSIIQELKCIALSNGWQWVSKGFKERTGGKLDGQRMKNVVDLLVIPVHVPHLLICRGW